MALAYRNTTKPATKTISRMCGKTRYSGLVNSGNMVDSEQNRKLWRDSLAVITAQLMKKQAENNGRFYPGYTYIHQWIWRGHRNYNWRDMTALQVTKAIEYMLKLEANNAAKTQETNQYRSYV